MRIAGLRVRTVCVPIEAPLRHSSGVHPGYFIRTILELHTDDGLVGLGEVGGDQRGRLEAAGRAIVGEDPFHLERIKLRTLSRVHYLRSARVYAAIEMACLDLMGKATGRRVCDLLGGPVRDRVPFTAYVFARDATADTPAVAEPEEVVDHTRDLVTRYGFTAAKVKGGVRAPEHDVLVVQALREAFGPAFGLRLDPNGVWSVGTSLRTLARLAPVDLEYLEDPTWGLPGMARVKARTPVPLATNMVVTEFAHLAPAVAAESVDIVLGDIYHFDGLTGLRALASTCETFGLGLSMHSGTELGVALAAMVHVGATIPNLSYAADAHYHHLLDDVISGGKLAYADGAVAVPAGPGLGVALDPDRMDRYEAAFAALGEYRSDWSSMVPAW